MCVWSSRLIWTPVYTLRCLKVVYLEIRYRFDGEYGGTVVSGRKMKMVMAMAMATMLMAAGLAKLFRPIRGEPDEPVGW